METPKRTATEEAQLHLGNAKKELYKEELKSAIFATVFGLALAYVIVAPFSLMTVLCIIVMGYWAGFFRPTIKAQIHLGGIISNLKEIIANIENPPEPETEPKNPNKPWSTK